MCELLIATKDKTSTNPNIDAKLVKRGVVVDVFADGHNYGKIELTSAGFRILKMPAVAMAYGQSLTGAELGDHAGSLARVFLLNLDHPGIAADLASYLTDDLRKVPSFVTDEATVETLKVTRPSTVHPSEMTIRLPLVAAS
jgi:hypothetical protein